LGTAK